MNRRNSAQPKPGKAAGTAARAQDAAATERRRIRQLLQRPMLQRTHFLRVRIGRGSAL